MPKNLSFEFSLLFRLRGFHVSSKGRKTQIQVKNKPLRALHLEGIGSVADGGTIVSQTGEIAIKSIEQKQGTTQIYYQIKE